MIDHSDHWKAVLEKRFKYIQNRDPENFNSVSKPVASAFKKEVIEWMGMLQKIKSQVVQIMSAIYRHDDVSD